MFKVFFHFDHLQHKVKQSLEFSASDACIFCIHIQIIPEIRKKVGRLQLQNPWNLLKKYFTFKLKFFKVWNNVFVIFDSAEFVFAFPCTFICFNQGPSGGHNYQILLYIYIYVQTNYQRKFEMIPHTEDVLLSFTKIKILDIIKNFMDIFRIENNFKNNFQFLFKSLVFY